MIKKFCVLFLLFLISVATGKGLYYAKDGFNFRRIYSLNGWMEESLSYRAQEILKQPFYYLGRGRQCFAFASKDGNYVLKFPRTDIYKTPFWLRVLPFDSYRKKLEENHKKREEFIRNSFQISFKELQNQTGMLALHLGKSDSSIKLKLIDKMGCKHSLPLGTTSFALQEKHPILMQEFTKAMQKKDLKLAQKIVDQLLLNIVDRASKGILNRDRSFLRNYGFDGEKAYQIDVGSFFHDPNLTSDASYQKSIRDSIDPIQEWLAENSPDMLDYLNNKLKEFL